MLSQKDVTFVVPSYNNLRHLKNCYESIKKNAPACKLVLLDDGSTDGMMEWVNSLLSDHDDQSLKVYRSAERVGHTILYDRGIALADTSVVGILHADMIVGPNYAENLLKHLKPMTVVCATRIEPPLHPEGKEKIIKDFGMDFDSLNVAAFEEYALSAQKEFEGQRTSGMFAPWVLYKEDFNRVGGHDALFAPFPYEDSDIFQRWMMQGYEMVQSRDSFVYHLTCRGHRWGERVGVDDDYFKRASARAARNYLRKWGSWIKNDEYQLPIVPKKHNVGIVVEGSSVDPKLVEFLEPWCSALYLQDKSAAERYSKAEQQNTLLQMASRVKYGAVPDNDVVVHINPLKITNDSILVIQQLQEIIQESGGIGEFELAGMRVEISRMEPTKISIRPLFSTD